MEIRFLGTLVLLVFTCKNVLGGQGLDQFTIAGGSSGNDLRNGLILGESILLTKSVGGNAEQQSACVKGGMPEKNIPRTSLRVL